jgi:hypothetical protein
MSNKSEPTAPSVRSSAAVDDGSLAATKMSSADTESGNPEIRLLIEIVTKKVK